MSDISVLIMRHNPRDIPATDTAFYSWLTTSDSTDVRVEAIIEYLDGMYDFDINDFVVSEFALATLRAIYSIWWYNTHDV